MYALNIATESFFEQKYVRFIRNTMHIMSLFHHLRFVRYKRLLFNKRKRYKGPSQKDSVPWARRLN
jgi:hypothetical protein